MLHTIYILIIYIAQQGFIRADAIKYYHVIHVYIGILKAFFCTEQSLFHLITCHITYLIVNSNIIVVH